MEQVLADKVKLIVTDSKLAFMQGRYEESLRLAKQALDIDRKNANAHQCAGNAYMSREDYESAIKSYKKAIEYDADNGDRYFNLGYAYATANQPVKALEMFAKADEVGCSPNVVGQLYKIMGMLCFDLQRYEDAVLNLIKSEKIVGIDMDVLQRKALSYSMSGQTAAGIEVANQMKILAPTNYLGYRIAFNVLLQEERLEEAEKELDRAERFANPDGEVFSDWVAYENARYELDGEKDHLYKAIDKLYEGLCVVPPDVDFAVQSYLNAAEIYVTLENADMAIHCLNAAENPVQSFNMGFSVKEMPELVPGPSGRPSEREINHAVEAVRRRYGDRRLETMGREMTAKARRSTPDADKYMTPVEQKEETVSFHMDEGAQATYSEEILDRIYRLYVAAYTMKNDTVCIKAYASKLANSSDPHSQYIGKYSLVKALKAEGYEQAEEEYRSLLVFFRNELIKDPSDLMALSFRVQCHIDLDEYDEAERLCDLLSDEFKKPLLEKIREAQTGGDT
ncbi:MAG: tetratricopeptide repeat protein [Ruminococcus sp.]|nr:tetratricopeptide repeat protein [Ruminococcus sp.]